MKKYPILRLQNNALYQGQEIYIFGKSNTSQPETNMRLGRNEVAFVYSTMYWYLDDPGLGPNESQTTSGDSGAPSFTIFNGAPAVLGVHSFVNQDTFSPDFIPELNAAMAPESVTVLTELDLLGGSWKRGPLLSPEPASLFTGVLGFIVLAARRPRPYPLISAIPRGSVQYRCALERVRKTCNVLATGGSRWCAGYRQRLEP